MSRIPSLAPAGERSNAESALTTVPVTSLRTDATLRSPMYDDQDDRSILLLAAGTVLTPAVLQTLARRGITRVRVRAADLGELTGVEAPAVRPAAAPAPATSPGSSRPRPKAIPFQAATKEVESRFAKDHDESIDQVNRLLETVARGDIKGGNAFADVSQRALNQLSENRDLFIALGVSPAANSYPGKHSLHVSKLAMAIGHGMGLGSGDLVELSLGCLVHDLGMLKISRDLYESPRRLGPVEFLEITKHPAITYEMVQGLTQLTTGSRMVAYQMHERWNGSGYPRRRDGRRIHPLSRIAAVADVFVAAISPRPHRPALLPYYAIEEIIAGTRAGLFDPAAVRGLLEAVAMFPVGSNVELSDGRAGRVVHANGELFARPVVAIPAPTDAQGEIAGEPQVVDLASERHLSVLRPLATLRLVESQFVEDNWE